MLIPENDFCEHCEDEHAIFPEGIYAWYCSIERPHPMLGWECPLECGAEGVFLFEHDGCDDFPFTTCTRCDWELTFEDMEYIGEGE